MGSTDPEGSAPVRDTTTPGEQSEPTVEEKGRAPAPDPLRSSRASGMWTAMVLLVVLLGLLAVFVLQNTQPVEISFLGWTGEAPLAAAMLIATAAGLLLAVAAGSVRILQLRRRVRRERRSGAARG